jgi:hypothetical protein
LNTPGQICYSAIQSAENASSYNFLTRQEKKGEIKMPGDSTLAAKEHVA